MNTAQIILLASNHLEMLNGHVFDVLTLTKPVSPKTAVNLAKVISKLSPLLGNLIEFNIVELLNKQEVFHPFGNWVRQDPGFPDTIFKGAVQPTPGFEIKAWFPLASEITARFRDSQNHFMSGNTYIVLLAWLPEVIIYGKPRILNVTLIEGGSVARARDDHYHNPPDYLVLEPGNTRLRTRNLQQTNASGYKWQGTPAQFIEAQRIVAGWDKGNSVYRPTEEYQLLLRDLLNRYPYRLDTNFAKIDRIMHPGIEAFKRQVYDTAVHGMTVRQWMYLFGSRDEAKVAEAFSRYLSITEADADTLVL